MGDAVVKLGAEIGERVCDDPLLFMLNREQGCGLLLRVVDDSWAGVRFLDIRVEERFLRSRSETE